MTGPAVIGADDVDRLLDWSSVVDALAAGHLLPRASVEVSFNEHRGNSIMNLSAWIDGLGGAVKTCSIFPGNTNREPPLETVQGVVILYDGDNGMPKALIEGASMTRWKTVGDSLLGARYLARPDPKTLLIIGAGVIGQTSTAAYPSLFPSIETVLIWNRHPGKANKIAAGLAGKTQQAVVKAAGDLETAVGQADIVSCATLATAPVVLGEWLRPGQHIDLIGAYLPGMREVDDAAMRRAELYIDGRRNTVEGAGEFLIPLANGSISEADVKGDLYALAQGGPPARDASAITLFKNGGGAHLDLMVADLVHRRYLEQAD